VICLKAGLDSIKQLRGDNLIAAHKERYGDKTLLAFSRGKDSIAVALALRD
jgi:tRNA(Ile)-lysidine synthase TilS/MesJ